MGTKIYGSRSELTNIKFRTSGDSKEVAVQPPTSLAGASNTLTTPNISGTSDTLISRVSVDTGSNALKNKDLESTTITVVDATDNTKKLLFDLTGISTATTRTLTIPNASTTIVGTDIAQTLTNKTIAAGSNTISGITDTNISAAAAIARTKLASGTAGHVLINDGSGVMSSELTLSKVRGGTGADNSSVTFPSSGVIVTETATETLTNKTIDATSNTLSNIANANVAASAAIDRTKLASGTADHVIINDASGVLSSEAALSKVRGGTGIDNSSVTFPSSGTITTNAGLQTLTNKTINAASNTISNIANTHISSTAAIARSKIAPGIILSGVVINAADGTLSEETTLAKVRGGTGANNSSVTFPSTGTIVTQDATETLTNKTLTSPVISTPSISSPTVSGTLLLQNAAGAQPVLALSEDPDNGTNVVNLQAAASMASDYTLTLPATVASTGQVLTAADNAGALGWTSPLTNPMTTQGDIIVGGASGAATRLAHPGASGQALMTNSTTTQAWTGSPSFSGSVTAATGIVLSSGTLDLSSSTAGRISFPAAQNASSGANTLDDYEEGTYLPSVSGVSLTLSTWQGYYIKVGSTVHVHMYFVWTAASGTGSVVIGLPFTSLSTSSYRFAGSVGYTQGITLATNQQFTIGGLNNVANFSLSRYNTTLGTTSDITGSNFGASGQLQLSITYQANA